MKIEHRIAQVSFGVFPGWDAGLAGPACAGDVVAAAALLAADREYAEDAPRDVESPLFGTTQGMRLAGRAIFIEQEHSHLGCFNLVVC